jgi:hypothetical protein
MKSLSSVLWLATVVLACLSCKSQISCEPTAEEKEVIKTEIVTLVRDLWNPENTGYETNDALRNGVDDYIMGSDGQIIFTNYTEFDNAMKASFASVQRFIEADVPSIHVYVLSKDAAACTYLFKSKFLTTSGDTIPNNGCWTFVLKKFANGWKVVQENGTHTLN